MPQNCDNLGYRLIKGRLGVYDDTYAVEHEHDAETIGLNDQLRRLGHEGGKFQQQRMISDKKRSLQRALKFSYQAAKVKKENESIVKALINPNQVKQDYDDKIISIFYDHNYHSGDVFEWIGTNTFWLIYLQDLTELAYFKGKIRKCSNEIAWEDEDGVHKTYAAIRGPVETKISAAQGHGISIDSPNYTLSILMPKTDSIVKYFKRYSKFYLQGDEEYNICWRVEAVDWISVPGILEVIASEYYRNEDEDDVEAGLVGALIAKPITPNTDAQEDTIIGETFIKPGRQYEYKCRISNNGTWTVDKKVPVELQATDDGGVLVRWIDSCSGEFDLYYNGVYKKTIVVESLF